MEPKERLMVDLVYCTNQDHHFDVVNDPACWTVAQQCGLGTALGNDQDEFDVIVAWWKEARLQRGLPSFCYECDKFVVKAW